MLLQLSEVIDIIIMTLIVGFIFKDLFPRRPRVEVITPEHYLRRRRKGFNWNDFWYAAAIVAPSIILHEFGHKFVAIANGMSASFHSPISIQHFLNPLLIFGDFAALLMVVAVVMKILGAGFLFFVPAYVSITGTGTALQSSIIAFAGPAVNLVLWIVPLIITKRAKLKREAYHFLFLVSRVNMFLFIFNMLPIPGFDGYHVFSNLFSAIL
ncbi:MAG TPA: M50 family metallopeptidase [Candidatus Nanoarchaeia archaeon]|nr:M50 family metallopeptidase [Candidatus Nanoarchaeia archaeon]